MSEERQLTPEERAELYAWFFGFGAQMMRESREAGGMEAREREIMLVASGLGGEGEEDGNLARIQILSEGGEDIEDAERLRVASVAEGASAKRRAKR